MTTMLNWPGFQQLDSMERWMRRMFEGVGFAPILPPAADIYETQNEFVMELEVPGYAEQELGIEVFDHTVRVTGERAEAKEDEEKSFHLRERLEHKFERRFELPVDADTEHVRARFARGVLEVHAPKLAGSKGQKVEITKA
jgi:HSP20 family protein